MRNVAMRMAAGAAAAGLALIPAAAAVGALATRPKPGHYTAGSTVSFNVSRSQKVQDIVGTAPVASGCKRPYGGFQLPSGPAKISRGHFKVSASNYPGHPTVSIVGHFTKSTEVKGVISVHYAKSDGCNDREAYTATRS